MEAYYQAILQDISHNFVFSDRQAKNSQNSLNNQTGKGIFIENMTINLKE